MNKTIWKAVFFITLTIFAVLTVLLIAFIFALLTQPSSANTSIIGGADLPTYHFLLSKILQGSIFNIWLGSLLTVIISLIGWLTAKK